MIAREAEYMKVLWDKREAKYQEFSSSLVPGCRQMLGVRIPTLRVLAKELAKTDYPEWLTYVHSEAARKQREQIMGFAEPCFEEQVLEGLILGYAKADSKQILANAVHFVKSIGDWSVNDCFCQTFTLAKREPELVWQTLVEPFLDSGEEFEQRVAAVLMLSHYLKDAYIDRVLDAYCHLKHEGYYAKMSVAWGICTAYCHYPEKTGKLLERRCLDPWTQNKAIQKMRESYRVSDADKQIANQWKM